MADFLARCLSSAERSFLVSMPDRHLRVRDEKGEEVGLPAGSGSLDAASRALPLRQL